MGSPRSRGVGERRQSTRVARPGKVHVHVDAVDLTGETENLSATDMLFYADQPLAVTVEIEEGGALRRVSGRLVRVEPMQGDRSGWAIEFA